MYNKSLSGKSAAEPAKTDLALQAEVEFPSVRYFQIHFEFLQDQLNRTLHELQALQIRMQQLEQRSAVKHNLPGHSALPGMPVASSQPASTKDTASQPGRR